MHDTPEKGIFGDDFRFVSSGCVRVQDVRDYVAWLLKDNPGWGRDQIDEVIRSGQRLDVKLTTAGQCLLGLHHRLGDARRNRPVPPRHLSARRRRPWPARLGRSRPAARAAAGISGASAALRLPVDRRAFCRPHMERQRFARARSGASRMAMAARIARLAHGRKKSNGATANFDPHQYAAAGICDGLLVRLSETSKTSPTRVYVSLKVRAEAGIVAPARRFCGPWRGRNRPVPTPRSLNEGRVTQRARVELPGSLQFADMLLRKSCTPRWSIS